MTWGDHRFLPLLNGEHRYSGRKQSLDLDTVRLLLQTNPVRNYRASQLRIFCRKQMALIRSASSPPKPSMPPHSPFFVANIIHATVIPHRTSSNENRLLSKSFTRLFDTHNPIQGVTIDVGSSLPPDLPPNTILGARTLSTVP